jgi:outer membrane receptor protein involved in Fe transport
MRIHGVSRAPTGDALGIRAAAALLCALLALGATVAHAQQSSEGAPHDDGREPPREGESRERAGDGDAASPDGVERAPTGADDGPPGEGSDPTEGGAHPDDAPGGGPLEDRPQSEGAESEGAESEGAQDEAEPGGDGRGEEGGAQSGVRGRIVNARTGEGLADAVVLANGPRGGSSATTDESGGYAIALPPGVYTLSALYDLFHGARMPRVRVRSARFTDLTLTLEPIDDSVVTEEVEIVYRADTASAAAQDQLRAASTGIGEGMGSQQMSRSGASDAGSAARNVVGVSLEGASLNVRGLGGRYTLVLLNGVSLPSTDPDVPAVDLDLFPTSVIDSLQVSKAFLPDLPGNFAGGVLDLRTVRFPTRFTFELGASLGINTQATFADRLSYRGGDLDFLAIDDGTRALPSGLQDRVQITRSGPYDSFAAIEAAAERFPNVWQYERALAVPGLGFDVTLGDSIDLGGQRRFGYLVTAGYGYDLARTLGTSVTRPRFAADGSLEAFGQYDVEVSREEMQLSALGTASLELGQDDVFTLLSLFNRSATDETQLQSGENAELGAGQRTDRWQMQWIARTLWFNQLRGDHRNLFGSRLRLRWTGFASYGGREEPDRRSVTYGPQGSLLRWLEKSQSGERFYSDLDQLDGGGHLDLRFPLWSEGWGTVGGDVRYSSREFLIRRLRMLQDPRNMDQEVYTAPIEQLFDAQAIGTITRLQEFTRPDDSYLSTQGYYAAFAMLETPLVGPLSVTMGARFEAFEQAVQSRSPFLSERDDGDTMVRGTSRTDLDVLPAANFRLELEDHMVLRAGYGMTVARPQVRELAPYQYYDFVRDRNVQGNPDLVRTLIQNVDLRWEWFFGEGEILAVSAFYKYFESPIELQVFNPSTYDSQYVNAREAQNVGAELEGRLSLRRLSDALEHFTLAGNLALIWSQVSFSAMDAGAVQAERPLYGQAPYVANLSLAFDHPETGLSASLVYNVVGPRVDLVGTRVNERILPNQLRDPFHSLDLVLGWRLDDHLRLRVKARNLLYQEQTYSQGNLITERVQAGTSVTLSIAYSE